MNILFRHSVILLALHICVLSAHAAEWRYTTPAQAEGAALVERLRAGGLVMYFRHADTTGMPCDSTYRIGERDGQRNISAAGVRQSHEIGEAFERLGIPVALPVLAGPVYRARDTAEHAFGPERVEITDDLLADDYAGGRLQAVLEGHRRLMNRPPPDGLNSVLVAHRTPAIMTLGREVAGRAFPEGAALVLEPGETGPRILGILLLAPYDGDGFHLC